MSASSWIYNHPNPDDADNDSFAESYDFDSRTTSSYCSSSWWQEPMVVGYAFGPKKMSTMSVVMAEASRAEVIHEEQDDEQNLFYTKTIIDSHMEDINLEKSSVPPIRTIKTTRFSSNLTSEALEGLERGTTNNPNNNNNNKNNNAVTPKTSSIIHFGATSTNNSSDIKSIVRHFRSSCSSTAASVSETTVSTPTTSATTLTRRSPSRFPIRISFVPLDPDFPLHEQHGGNFDLILHKLTEDILSCSLGAGDAAAQARVMRLKDYQLQHPSCCLIDDPNSVITLMSRSAISCRLQECLQDVTSASGIPVTAPKYIVVNQEDTLNIQQQLQQKAMTVPLIVKPLVAAGTKESHYMTILIQQSERAMKRIPPNSLIQQYVNHDAVLYKVYVMGQHFHVYKRASVPNLPPDISKLSNKDLVEFDSQHPYPRLQDFGLSTESGSIPQQKGSQRQPLVSSDEVRPIVDALKRAFGLELFGFDILVSAEKQEWLVVDVNYFPSYKEVPNFPNQLAHYLTQRVLHQRRQNLQDNEEINTR